MADIDAPAESLKDQVRVKCFEQTSSTKLELQTILWALNEIVALPKGSDIELIVYTDSQNIIGLPRRQDKLEQNDYVSSNGKRLNNFELYQEFYRLTSLLNCRFVKVKGHQPSRQKTKFDRLFGLVDQQSRKALRAALN